MFYRQTLLTCLLFAVSVFVGLMSFEAKAQNSMSIELPLLINNSYIGDITTLVNPSSQNGKDTAIDITRLMELAEPFISENQRKNWFESVGNSSYVAIGQLQDNGLDINFDPALLNISVKIIKDGISYLSLSNREAPNLDQYEPLANFASGLNVALFPSYIHQGDEQGWAPLEVDFTGFTSINGFNGLALIYSADYSEDSDNQFSRGDVTLIHNNFKHAIRYALGDIRPTVSRFQSSIDMAGLSIERDYSRINPFRNLRPNGRNTFTLTRDAEVSFQVNGVTVLTRELTAGSYDVSDFPLITGNNDVTIVIDDGGSQKEISRFSTYVDSSLLSKGVTNFGVNVGFPVDLEAGSRKRKYESDPVALAFIEKGVTDKMTLGLLFEVAEKQQLLATSSLLGNRYGFWVVELAGSNKDDIGEGYSGLIQYELEPNKSFLGWASSLSLQAQHKSEKFVNLGQSETSDERNSINARLKLQKGKSSVNFGSSYSKTGTQETKSFSINLSRSFRLFSLSLNTQYSQQNDAESDTRFSINMSKKIGERSLRKTHRLSARYNSKDHQSNIELKNTSGSNMGDASYKIALQNSDVSKDVDLDTTYNHGRFEAELSHKLGRSQSNDSRTQSTTNLGLRASIGFADGNFSFGRPFNNGFIILKRHKTLENKKVVISKSAFGDSDVSSTQTFNTVLIPLNSSFRGSSLIVDVEDLPIGYDIGGGQIKVFPNQTPAYAYQLGSNASNMIMGSLYDKQDKPLSLISGKLIPRKKTNDSAISFFTNKTGRFVADKVAEGIYDIQLLGSEAVVGEITVKQAGEPGLIDVGKNIIEVAND